MSEECCLIKSELKAPIIVDLRNIYDPADVRRRGFKYVSVGRTEQV